MSDFDTFWEAVKTGLPDLAKQLGQQYLEAALKDGKNFLASQQAELQHWTEELTTDLLSKEEFEDLVKGQADLAEMELLKQAGLAKVQIDSFINGVLKLVVDSAFKVFLQMRLHRGFTGENQFQKFSGIIAPRFKAFR